MKNIILLIIVICQLFLINCVKAQITDSLVDGNSVNYYNAKKELVKYVYKKFSKQGVIKQTIITNYDSLTQREREVVTEYYPSGKTSSIIIRKQHLPSKSKYEFSFDDSLRFFYYEDGNIASEYKFRNDNMQEATQYTWIRATDTSKKFLYQKQIDTYFKSRKPISTTLYHYTVKGQLLFKYIYYRKKVLQIEIHFKDGQTLTKPEIIKGDCKFTFCNADGKLCCECEYKNGRVIHCHPIK